MAMVICEDSSWCYLWYDARAYRLIHPIHPTHLDYLQVLHEEQLEDSATTPIGMPRYRRSTPLIDADRHCHQSSS